MKLYKVTIGWTTMIKANDMDQAIRMGRAEDGKLLSRTEKAVEAGEVKEEALSPLPFNIDVKTGEIKGKKRSRI